MDTNGVWHCVEPLGDLSCFALSGRFDRDSTSAGGAATNLVGRVSRPSYLG